MQPIKRMFALLLVACMLMSLLPSAAMAEAGLKAKANLFMEFSSDSDPNRYLTTVGSNAFNVFMYNNTFSGTFGDQHMGGIELSLNGTRIATNGDLHLLPTPEQWDATPAPKRGEKQFDEATQTITVPMSFSGATDGLLKYDLVASPTEDGLRLQMILRTPMPESLRGKARFNLEFLPASYESKTFSADRDADGVYDQFGTFPLHPQDEMEETERAELPTQMWYVKDWNEERGDAQPVPFATAYGFSFAPEDESCAITLTSNTNDPMELLDGRNRAQNGWYVLSTLITATDVGQVAADWTIKPNVKQGWVRPANVGFSQVGYTPEQEKFAVVELDKWGVIGEDYPSEISLCRIDADGTRTEVKTGVLDEASAQAWQRYKYVRFDFSDIKQAGLYCIKYGEQTGEVFPIADDVYDDIWQTCLSGFLAVQMDHISVRDGYRIWHGASHMDDGSIGPLGVNWFDGMSMPSEMPASIAQRGIEPEQHLDGLNQGGWFDAGDFDIQTARNVQVLGELINAAESTGNMDDYDTLSVEWNDATGGTVEMHRPDGVPDIVQQAVHGSKQLLAQYEVLGGIGGTMEVRRLRQYTHLGDPSSDTDGYIYDPSLEEGEIVERDGKVYSGVDDDRYFLLAGGGGTFSSTMFTANGAGNPSNFAGTAYLAADYYPEYAVQIMNAANQMWYDERLGKEPDYAMEFDCLVQYALATNKLESLGLVYEDYDDQLNYAYYKARLDGMIDQALEEGVASRVSLLFLKDLMDEAYWQKVTASVDQVAASQTENTAPYGVNFTEGSGWGGSPNTYAGVRNISMIYNFFPKEEFEQNILRSVDYLLGCHPATNASWISGVGTKSALHPYNSNRAEESYIPGSILPGHITFSPDYVESMDDFSFLWFEGESIINYQSSWLPVGLAASKIADNQAARAETLTADTTDFESSLDLKLIKKTISSFAGSSEDGYLADDGFNVFMYSTTFDRTFGDQHCAGIELIQNGRRIATNGDIHLLPTPEQWDATPAPIIGERKFDEATNTITVSVTLPAETLEDGTVNPEVHYALIAEPEEGGVKLTLKIDGELPADLLGKAGFNLEFLPAVYTGKSFQADSDGDGVYDSFGVFPLTPSDDMEEIGRARTANQSWYVQQWNEDRGDYQPMAFAEGQKMTFAAEDDDYRIRISCDDGLALYDGRNRAQNGWFVLRTLIPEGKDEIVWHISADTAEHWTREPNIAHSQVGYEPEMEKVAVIELDPADKGPDTAQIKKLDNDGNYTVVRTVELGEPMTWNRYCYRDVDFTDVKEPGTYVIEYAGVQSDPFPIKKGVYADIWQQSLSNYMAVQMDHMRIREGYKIWRNAPHMDDALQAPTGMDWFDAGVNGSTIETGYAPYEHIDGLDVGGFSDAGDFDIQTLQNIAVINTLAMAYEVFGEDYDTLQVDWQTHNVEMHRPDGISDLQELVKHGALNIMAQQENIGFLASVIEVPTLRQYTHLGDGSKDTDGKLYDPTLDADEVDGLRSGLRDDRLAFAFTKNTSMQVSAIAALASTSVVLRGVDDETADKAIQMAEEMWIEEGRGAASDQSSGWFAPDYWSAAISLFKATGKDEYKDYIIENFDNKMATEGAGWGGPAFASSGWKVVRVLDQLGEEYKAKFEAALKAYAPNLSAPNAGNPFGVSDTFGMWGGSGTVADGATTAAILHKYYPDIVGTDSVFRAINYLLGTHPYNNTSWVSGVGTKSLEKGYGSNRADQYYIAGGLAPGYVTIAPDFPEQMDDFNFLWFENEYTVQATASWILLSIGADDFAREHDEAHEHVWKAFVTAPSCTGNGSTHSVCTVCYETKDTDETAALGHDWDEGKVTQEPFATFDGVFTYTCKRCGATKTEPVPTDGSADMSDIDFLDPASVDRILIENQSQTELQEQGLYMVSTTEAFEPCSGRNDSVEIKDVVKIPTQGDWTATIKVHVQPTSGFFSGFYEFFGIYAMTDYSNGVGIRCGNNSIQDFAMHEGAVTAETQSTDTGLLSAETHFFRITKTGDRYACYWSTAGDADADFGEPIFTFNDTGVEAKGLTIDAYSGWATGYQYWIESVHFTDVK